MAKITAAQSRAILHTAELVADTAAIHAALDRLAAQLTAAVADRDPLFLLVMNGAAIFAGHLLPRLAFPLEIGYLHATRYRGATRGGELHWRVPPSVAVADRVVVVLDDIYDEGLTLQAIVDSLKASEAAAVYSAVLATKVHDRKPAQFAVDFCGLELPDRYVFGFGMDYGEYLRQLPAIYAAKDA